jgi:hypothetical protein
VKGSLLGRLFTPSTAVGGFVGGCLGGGRPAGVAEHNDSPAASEGSTRIAKDPYVEELWEPYLRAPPFYLAKIALLPCTCWTNPGAAFAVGLDIS